MTKNNISGYVWENAELNCSHEYLLPELKRILTTQDNLKHRRLFELGCGNGSVADELVQLGWSVTGVDPSEQGISQAKLRYPNITLNLGSAYDNLVQEYGQFPFVVSLEVVEHVYAPRKYAATLFDLVEQGGVAIVSTPFHSYWKNLVLALSGKMDNHFTALWDHGHIKFWSERTLQILLEEAGFKEITFKRVGRIHPLAKSMIAIARKT